MKTGPYVRFHILHSVGVEETIFQVLFRYYHREANLMMEHLKETSKKNSRKPYNNYYLLEGEEESMIIRRPFQLCFPHDPMAKEKI